jgi:four helix bundle protein
MATFERFEDMECWQLARRCQQLVYRLTRKPAFDQDIDLRRQLRRAAVSVSSNIAEGFERNSNKEFAQFLKIAKGSNGEVRSQLYVALDESYIDQKEFATTVNLLEITSSKLSALRAYIMRTI